jgi:DNA-binding transcriptional MocR family regulator
MALWARVSPGIDLDAWLERAQQAGLLVHPARHDALDRRPRRALRLSFSGRSEQASDSALQRLAACL